MTKKIVLDKKKKENIFRSFINKIQNDKRYLVITSILIIILLLPLFYLLDQSATQIKLFKRTKKIETEYKLVKSTNNNYLSILLEVPEPTQLKDKQNPINGIMMTADEYSKMIINHPIAMTVNNHVSARPQHGLNKADVVLEILAEGGITRLVPIFYQNYDVEKVGPIRSLRYYMIEFALGYGDAMILHHGWAGHDGAPFETYREKTDARGAVRKHGVKSIQTAGSTYRDQEKARKDGYVHALYTGFGKVVPEVNRLVAGQKWKLGGEVVEPISFKFDEDISSRGDVKGFDFSFMSLGGSDYKIKFEYDIQSNTYKRSVGNKQDIDLNDNKQISPKNVIIEWHEYADGRDGHGRLIIETIGEGDVQIFRDGKLIEGKWKKECMKCRTKYYNKDGSAIEIVRGQIWIVSGIRVGERKISNLSIIE
jgi:hypothetical protein